MIRTPTQRASAYAWHSQALADIRDGLQISANNDPECGWYQRRLVKAGPLVPARIWLYSEVDPETGELAGDELLQCEVAGEYRDPDEQWSWLCGNPISEAEFNYMTAVREHVAVHSPDEPLANPRQAVDWLKVPVGRFA